MWSIEGELTRTIRSIWMSILEMPISPCLCGEARGCLPGAVRAEVLVGSEPDVKVVLHCSRAMANEAARRMFARGPHFSTEGDLQDAVAQLALIIGESVRDCVARTSPVHCTRLPKTPDDPCSDCKLAGTTIRVLHFDALGMPFHVSVEEYDHV